MKTADRCWMCLIRSSHFLITISREFSLSRSEIIKVIVVVEVVPFGITSVFHIAEFPVVAGG